MNVLTLTDWRFLRKLYSICLFIELAFPQACCNAWISALGVHLNYIFISFSTARRCYRYCKNSTEALNNESFRVNFPHDNELRIELRDYWHPPLCDLILSLIPLHKDFSVFGEHFVNNMRAELARYALYGDNYKPGLFHG